MLMGESIEYRRLHAPSEDGSTLIEPPLSDVASLLDANARRHAVYDYDLQGRSLRELAHAARADLLNHARAYTAKYRDVDPPDDAAGPVLLAGHQPQLFHPGVWFKNFTLGRLVSQHRGVGVNLLIDVDTIRNASLRVPGGSVVAPTASAVPVDQPTDEVPFEQRRIIDPKLFATFGRRTAETIRPLVSNPLIERLWPLAVECARSGANLGQCLAQARHQTEGEWGLTTLDLPQSSVCQFEAFHWFAAHLLASLPRFWEIYNGALAEYRRAYHIRSHSHPVPNLTADTPWLEAPFWIWTDEDPKRRPLFARQQGDQMVLSDRHHLELTLDLTPEGEADRAVEQLAELPRRGVKLRTRALTTTMFARLFLGDLFLHGIGGAKYDQVNDLVMRQFFGLQPPNFLVVSATLCLPIDRARVTDDDHRQIRRLLRELDYNPQRHVDRTEASKQGELDKIDQLVQSKLRWVQTAQTPENAQKRHQEITRVNASLQPWVAGKRSELIAQQEKTASALHTEAILSSREYAFCLYPEETLRDFLLVNRPTSS